MNFILLASRGASSAVTSASVVIASRWPIDRIWRANRPEATAEVAIDLAAGGVWLEVSRADANIIMRALDPATFAFRSTVQWGDTLERATEAALVADPTFDLCQALPALFLDVTAPFR
jgi:hypothetical protein